MGVKLSDLTTESAPASNDILLIADPTTGIAKKITVSALKTYMDGLGGGSDATAPTIVSATATTANTIVIVFSESVTVTTAGWSFKLNGVAWTISSVMGSGATWTFTMSSSANSTDTILRSYNSATGATVDTASNELVTFTDQAVTNSIPASFDSDALAFFSAAGITDNTQKNAVNQLVTDFKSYGIWTKMLLIRPYVGGNATAHAYNLKNPATFLGTFSGTHTHSSTGVDPAGGATYETSGITPTTHLTDQSIHISIYLRENIGDNNGYEWGVNDSGAAAYFYANPKMTSGNSAFNRIHDCYADSTPAVADSRGLFVLDSDFANFTIYRNGASVLNNTTVVLGNEATIPMFIGNYNNNGSPSGTEGSARERAFFSVGTHLTATEVANMYTAVQAFQTTLGRNV